MCCSCVYNISQIYKKKGVIGAVLCTQVTTAVTGPSGPERMKKKTTVNILKTFAMDECDLHGWFKTLSMCLDGATGPFIAQLQLMV